MDTVFGLKLEFESDEYGNFSGTIDRTADEYIIVWDNLELTPKEIKNKSRVYDWCPYDIKPTDKESASDWRSLVKLLDYLSKIDVKWEPDYRKAIGCAISLADGLDSKNNKFSE